MKLFFVICVSSFVFYSIRSETIGHIPFGYGLELDTWRDFTYIPNRITSALEDGTLYEWHVRFHHRESQPRNASLKLQVWRPTSRINTYTLIGDTPVFEVLNPGVQERHYKIDVRIRRGDVLGFKNNYPYKSYIPFKRTRATGYHCSHPVHYLRFKSITRIGEDYLFKELPSSYGPCREYSYEAKVFYDRPPTSLPRTTTYLPRFTHRLSTTHSPLPTKSYNRSSYVGKPVYSIASTLDKLVDFISIPDPITSFRSSGRIMEWKFRLFNPSHSVITASLNLQIWRPSSSPYTYRLVGESRVVRTVALGTSTHRLAANIRVRKGDVLGFQNVAPFKSLLPYTQPIHGCFSSRRTLYKRYVRNVDKDRYYTFTQMSGTNGACRDYLFGATVIYDHNQTTIGHINQHANQALDNWENFAMIPDSSLAAKNNGRVVAWKVNLMRNLPGSAHYKFALQVWRPSTIPHLAKLVNQTLIKGLISQGVTQRYLSIHSIHIRTGDMIGFKNYDGYKSVIPYKTSMFCPTEKSVLYKRYSTVIGHTYKFNRLPSSANPCRQYSFQAVINYNDILVMSSSSSESGTLQTRHSINVLIAEVIGISAAVIIFAALIGLVIFIVVRNRKLLNVTADRSETCATVRFDQLQENSANCQGQINSSPPQCNTYNAVSGTENLSTSSLPDTGFNNPTYGDGASKVEKEHSNC